VVGLGWAKCEVQPSGSSFYSFLSRIGGRTRFCWVSCSHLWVTFPRRNVTRSGGELFCPRWMLGDTTAWYRRGYGAWAWNQTTWCALRLSRRHRQTARPRVAEDGEPLRSTRALHRYWRRSRAERCMTATKNRPFQELTGFHCSASPRNQIW